MDAPTINRSRSASSLQPDLPNRSFRPRLKEIRWVANAPNKPEVYPLGRPHKLHTLRPNVPPRLGIHCRDQAVLRIQPSIKPWIYKEPHVILSIVNDKATQHISEQPGLYFALWLVTSHQEMALVTFDLVGDHDPLLHQSDAASGSVSASGVYQPLVVVEDGAWQSAASAGDSEPEVYLVDYADQEDSFLGREHRPMVQQSDLAAEGAGSSGSSQPLISNAEQAFHAVQGSGLHSPELHMEDAATQAGSTLGDEHKPVLALEDRAQQILRLIEGDHRPMLFINETAAQTMSSSGEYGLSIVVQTTLEQAAQSILTRGALAAPLFEINVSDSSTLLLSTGAGEFRLYYPLDSLESYADGAQVDGLNAGRYWNGAFVARGNLLGIRELDSFESYTDGADVNALNRGDWTNNAFVARENDIRIYLEDDLETYAVQAPVVDTLNGGAMGWGGAWTFRPDLWPYYDLFDTLETYAVQSPIVDTLNGGSLWTSAWTFQPDIFLNYTLGDSLETYTVQSPIVDTLNAGSGFTTAWTFGAFTGLNYNGFKTGGASDNLYEYADENPVSSTLNSGYGWSAAWTINTVDIVIFVKDNFDSYADENPVSSTLNGGTGWSGAWNIP
jgi:hypothetical protein